MSCVRPGLEISGSLVNIAQDVQHCCSNHTQSVRIAQAITSDGGLCVSARHCHERS